MTASRGKKRTVRKGKNNNKWIYAVPALIWMIFIFYMSSKTGDGSSAVSNPITEFIVSLFQRVRKDTASVVDSMTGIVEVMVRKGAHMAEYGILFALICMAARKIGEKMSFAYSCIWAFAISFAYACTDELHQLFVAGRAGKGSDVIIDMCGVLLSFLISIGLKSTRGRIVTGFITAIAAVAVVMFLLLWNF